MAIARVTSGSDHNTTTGATTTGTIANFGGGATVGGPTTVLYVVVMCNDVTVLSPDPTVIWDQAGANQQLSLIKKSTGTGTYLAVFRYAGPTAGAGKSISLSGMSGSVRDCFGAVMYDGVDQGTPNDTENLVELTGGNTGGSSGTITSPAGDAILSFYGRHTTAAASPTVSGGGNALVLAQAVGGGNGFLGIAEDLDGADDTIDWVSASSGSPVTFITFNMNASGAIPPSVHLLNQGHRPAMFKPGMARR